MENHHAINGKTHYFDWAIFNSYVWHNQRVIRSGILFTIAAQQQTMLMGRPCNCLRHGRMRIGEICAKHGIFLAGQIWLVCFTSGNQHIQDLLPYSRIPCKTLDDSWQVRVYFPTHWPTQRLRNQYVLRPQHSATNFLTIQHQPELETSAISFCFWVCFPHHHGNDNSLR